MSSGAATEMSQKVKDFDGPSRQGREEGRHDDDESSSSEESDSGDEEQDHANAKKPLPDIFKDIILEIKHADTEKGDLNVLVGEQLDHNADKLADSTPQGRTILHMVADIAYEDTRKLSNVKPDISNLKPLISELLRRHPELAFKKDNDDRTPLHYAIKSQATKVVDFVADELGNKLDEVLLIEDNTKNNGLHAALNAPKLKKKIPLSLIKRVKSSKTFCKPNIEKLTPMHIAVEYERCNANQIKIVDEMINWWDIKHEGEALNVNVLNEDGDERSVFRHHQWTREKAAKKESAKETLTDKKSGKLNKPINDIQAEKETQDLPKAKRPVDPVPHLKLTGPRSGPKANPKSPSKLEHIQQRIVRKPTSPDMDAEKHEGSKVDPTASKSHGQAGPLETKKNKLEPATDKPKKSSRKMTQEQAANIIRDKLKMHYMCTRDNHLQIIRFLYGPKEGQNQAFFSSPKAYLIIDQIIVKHISFDLVGGASVLNEAILKNITFVKFDETLHYLGLPNVEVRMSKSSQDEECKGRRDYEAIFQWLKNNSVKQIIHLFVEDNKPCPHSDESIELALRDLKVIKTWDWHKSDIGSTTLLKAAPDVQEIVLYWSGRNAVLRGWSEEEGLNRLPKLKKITVHGTPVSAGFSILLWRRNLEILTL